MALRTHAPMSGWEEHAYLKRLHPATYQGTAFVHWSMTIKDRRTGWRTEPFHLQFREHLAHTAFRYGVCCPVYSLMPDHIHLLWIGWRSDANQQLGIRFLRRYLNRILSRSGYELQKQAYDNVLREKDRQRDAFIRVAWYIRANPLRAGLAADEDQLSSYPYQGCVVPGYPDLDIEAEDYWPRFWRMYESLCRRGLG